MLRRFLRTCPYCKSEETYVSGSKRLWDDVAIALLLRPVRCHGCVRRFYRPIFVPIPAYPGRMAQLKKPAVPTSESAREERLSA